MKSWMDSKTKKSSADRHYLLQAADEIPFPETVAEWMAGIRLLYGVPFQYLVPDERYLPDESIRFFRMDQNWMDALLAGAFSVGAGTESDAAASTVLQNRLREVLPDNLYRLRRQKMHRNHLARCGVPETSAPEDGYMGFLICSDMVKAYPGMEVTGRDSRRQKTRNLLRLEQLSVTVMLGIFDGPVDEINITEPSECLHFGARTAAGEIYVRRIEESGDHRIGDRLSDELIPIPIRSDRMVDVIGLQDVLHQKLKEARKGDSGSELKFTSAELALEMIEMAAQARWILKDE